MIKSRKKGAAPFEYISDMVHNNLDKGLENTIYEFKGFSIKHTDEKRCTENEIRAVIDKCRYA